MASESSAFNEIILDCGKELDEATQRIAEKYGLEEDVAHVLLLASADMVLTSRKLEPDAVLKARLLMEGARA